MYESGWGGLRSLGASPATYINESRIENFLSFFYRDYTEQSLRKLMALTTTYDTVSCSLSYPKKIPNFFTGSGRLQVGYYDNNGMEQTKL